MEDDGVVALDVAVRERLLGEVVALLAKQSGMSPDSVRDLAVQSLAKLEGEAVRSGRTAGLATLQELRAGLRQVVERFAAWQARILPVVNASSLRDLPCLDQLALHWIGEEHAEGWFWTSRVEARRALRERIDELVITMVEAEEVFVPIPAERLRELKQELSSVAGSLTFDVLTVRECELRDRETVIHAMVEWMVAEAQAGPFHPLEQLVVNWLRTELNLALRSEGRTQRVLEELIGKQRACVEEAREQIRGRVARLVELIRKPQP